MYRPTCHHPSLDHALACVVCNVPRTVPQVWSPAPAAVLHPPVFVDWIEPNPDGTPKAWAR